MKPEEKFNERGNRTHCVSEWCENPVPPGQLKCFDCIDLTEKARERRLIDQPIKALYL